MDCRVLDFNCVELLLVLVGALAEPSCELIGLLSVKSFRVCFISLLRLNDLIDGFLERIVFDTGQLDFVFNTMFGLVYCVFVVEVVSGKLVVGALAVIEACLEFSELIVVVSLLQVKLLKPD